MMEVISVEYQDFPKCVNPNPLDYDELRDWNGYPLWVRLKSVVQVGAPNDGWALCDLDRSSLVQGWYNGELYFDEYGYLYIAYPVRKECLKP